MRKTHLHLREQPLDGVRGAPGRSRCYPQGHDFMRSTRLSFAKQGLFDAMFPLLDQPRAR